MGNDTKLRTTEEIQAILDESPVSADGFTDLGPRYFNKGNEDHAKLLKSYVSPSRKCMYAYKQALMPWIGSNRVCKIELNIDTGEVRVTPYGTTRMS